MGSITNEGYLIINRGRGQEPYSRDTTGKIIRGKTYSLNTVAIMAEKYTIFCECGYTTRIENGKIINALSVTQTNEESTDYRI